MRQHLILAVTAAGLSLTFGGSSALAGYCGVSPAPVTCQRPAPPPMPRCAPLAPPTLQCQTPVVIRPGAPHSVDPVVIGSTQPMGHLRSIKFHGSPHVNIMRVHGQTSGIGLKDAPTGFTKGCHPESTTYCGQQTAAVPAPQPQPMPYIAPPLPVRAPAPVIHRPAHQYGSTALVRGTAYLPTSHVNRDYDTAVAVLNAGPIPARPAVNGGDVPHPSMFYGTPGYGGHLSIGQTSGNYNQTVAPMQPAAPSYGPGPGHWEQVSGPTMIGNMPATKVVCRRPGPAPMPTPGPVTCARQAAFGPSFGPVALAGAPQAASHNSRYGSNY